MIHVVSSILDGRNSIDPIILLWVAAKGLKREVDERVVEKKHDVSVAKQLHVSIFKSISTALTVINRPSWESLPEKCVLIFHFYCLCYFTGRIIILIIRLLHFLWHLCRGNRFLILIFILI